MIYAKVSAVNAIGQSAKSSEGQSGPVYTTPSNPVLKNDDEVTSAELIGLTWSEPASNGGTPILDYRVLQLKND